MPADADIAGHYARAGLLDAIDDALRAAGKDPARLVPADLSPVDEFHLGWRPATAALAAVLGLGPDAHLLDIGAGLGGPARHFAEACGCHVTGIDLTADYVAAANALTARCGLAGRVSFRQGSGSALPFASASFDAVTLIHVGMNIADKAALFAGMRRVLKPGGVAGIFDVMRIKDLGEESEIAWPVPWAAGAATSFLATPAEYRAGLETAGFAIAGETNRAQLALDIARAARERATAEGPEPLGLHLLMGPDTPVRLGNLMKAVADGIVAPVEIVARAA